MANKAGVDGIGVTILEGGQAVTPTNPLPVTLSGTAPAWGSSAEFTATAAIAAAGNTQIVAAVAGQRIYVTGYNFSLTAACVSAQFNDGAGTQLSAIGYGVVAGSEQNGFLEDYLFVTAIGQALVFNLVGAAAVPGSVQVRYRVA